MWLLVAIIAGGLLVRGHRWEKKKKTGLIYGPYGLKKTWKGKVGTPAEQNHARAQNWERKYHDMVRQRDEATQATIQVKKKLHEKDAQLKGISKIGGLVSADRGIMGCDHPHCVRAKAIMRKMASQAHGLADVRRAG